MTRINLVDVKTLTDQHLLAEYRELPRVFGLVKSRLEKGKNIEQKNEKYHLGKGHVQFFFDKLLFLKIRHSLIQKECLKRGFNISFKGSIDISIFPSYLCNDYSPTKEEIEVSRKRIQEKIESNKGFYRYYGKQY